MTNYPNNLRPLSLGCPKLGVPRIQALGVLASLCLGAVECHAQYTVTEVPALGGAWSLAWRINNFGSVAGASGRPEPNPAQGFVFDTRGFRDLSFLGDFSAATEINDADGILAHSYSAEGKLSSFYYHNGIRTAITAPDGSPAIGSDVNNRGTVVGTYPRADSDGSRAFYFHDGEAFDLGTLGGDESRAAQINDQGQIVGSSKTEDGRTRPFLYENGVMLDLGDIGGGGASAEGINEVGQVVGVFENTSDPWLHPFLYSDGVLVELAKDQGLVGNYLPMSINNGGSIVGTFDMRAELRAWIYTDGVLLDLNALIPADSGWFLSNAYDINDSGQIVGTGLLDGAQRAYILTPIIPEPKGLGILGGVILFSLIARSPRRRVV